MRAMMAWWRKKVVFPARRALAAVSARVRSRKTGGGGSLLKLHEDVQTCGYKDVQVMFEMLTSELEDPKRRKQQTAASWRPPSAWPSRSSSSIAAAQ